MRPCLARAGALALGEMTMPLDAEPETTDAELLARYAAGDRAAARSLTQRLTPRVFAQAYRLLGDQAEAEDVTQEAMMRLWRIAPDWDAERAQVTTWLYRVTANLATDQLRKRRRVQPGLEHVPEQADLSPGADARLQDRSRLGALREALASLPERQRMAVILRHFDGLGNPAIADRLEVSVEAVESLVARGKRALKARLLGQKDALGYEDG